jgi:hypothetical protein
MKKTKVILIIAGITLIKAAKSQDLLVMNDSTHLQAAVTEVQPSAIKYVKQNGGPTYVTSKCNVAYVVYSNGTAERFTKVPAGDLSKYDLDGSGQVPFNYNYNYPRVPRYHKEKEKDNEVLYKRKNYIGLNHLALLNSNISFTYMRDVQKEKLILQIPVAFGIGRPDITNHTYNGGYLNYGSRNTYNLMNYQVGAGLLFTPSFGEKVNFLIGPSFSLSQYDMSTKTTFMVAGPTSTSTPTQGVFKNDFVMFRQFYGATLGFMFRMSEKINMTLTANIGCKKDAYKEKDPFGIEYVNSQTGWGREANSNVLPYANFSWTIGYRF